MDNRTNRSSMIADIRRNFEEKAVRGEIPGWVTVVVGIGVMVFYLPAWVIKELRSARTRNCR
jgi:uncharacterized membrane protein